jgi:hypothetical protein
MMQFHVEDDDFSPTPLRAFIYQDVEFPAGSSYILRFDVYVAALGGPDRGLGGHLSWRSSNDLSGRIWSLDNIRGNPTGVHVAETRPIAPGPATLSFEAVLVGEWGGWAIADLDYVRVRKYVNPEPTVRVGVEESNCP